MGRYDFAPQRVHAHATQLLAHKRIVNPPPWYNIIAAVPPAERLTRPPLQRNQRPGGKKASRLFKPLRLQYEEDRLRWDYFNDHPWELAKPRVVLEDDGRDAEKWDWSIPLDHALNRPKSGATSDEGVRLDLEWDGIHAQQAGRPINGEAVVQRTNELLNSGVPSSHASTIALAEFSRHQHYTETSLRVAREEALATGAFFGPGPLEIGMMLEDRQYDGWRQWAEKEIVALKQLQGSAYTGQGVDGSGQDAALDAGTVDAEEGVAKG
ncbi:mitochondrial ribosomal small subunit component [Friedmanniomyces endolithicus]|uniref:Small ribosomal subunit protein mS23 n=1 Tax=Friedmanniomyces endolithicus TaxID=329885 RepID=A0AAN6KH08_9PEZI|nr:mitochondrial ribosomal small subunit component [Friedmanniomyces endolithicus]KAK0801391.1 mitochondrial ribosomal small subunit component [Friedmanniomyces endolithicus]KAK0807149.1 mitochondrial ribosomal small subunit component [Friedmanniomyces endolithicus]KAK0821154.1 mitochondrial ribosomal small subunit component [Friedmanniomyces endolithicus]KAK0851805.1 mitochondrial ribosomal small subunit component [Friedmanniomyces endolithicus]